ncbi:hypothetical protein [Parachitinimonas caeni]|uniref:Uncharacterized protein n=1 Tax=Parachitinimonas caeni TaxID=3031301 RepID=A0ABT7E3R5_9NEIS|nr:hypothetical protein [Parachitinimonas caeni]MDK2125978.1 hypothetical protein [Parachitinimonas caeni]
MGLFGFNKKPPYLTGACKALKLEGRVARYLTVDKVPVEELIAKADASALCSYIVVGDIFQRPGTLMTENNTQDQEFSVNYDKLTHTIGLSLRQGNMRQSLIFHTKSPKELAAEMGLALTMDEPAKPAQEGG